MKRNFRSRRNWAKVAKIRDLSFFLLPLALLLPISLGNALVIFFFLSTVLVTPNLKNLNTTNIKSIVAISAIFLLSVIGLTYTSYRENALHIIETRAVLFFLPIAICLFSPTDQQKSIFFRVFILSLNTVFVVCLATAIRNNVNDPGPTMWFNKWHYHYDHLTEPIGVHPLYTSIFVALAILVLLMSTLGVSKYLFFGNKMNIVFFGIFVLFLSLLSSRLIIVIVFLLGFSVFFIPREKQNRKSSSLIFLLLVSIVFLVFVSPVARERFEALLTSKPTESSSFSVDRLIIWTTAIKHIKTNADEYIFGGGTGSSESLMECLYRKEGINWDFPQKTNSHNQYIDVLLNQGFVGLLLFLSSFFILARKFLTNKNRVAVLFLFLMILALAGENYLSRQKGVVFFSLFCSLFCFNKFEAATHRPHLKEI